MSRPTSLVIVAAGAGTRMRSDTKKPYLELAGEPVLFHTLRRFVGVPYLDEIVLVVAPDDVEAVAARWPQLQRELGVTRIVAGGQERFDSVLAGIEACTSSNAEPRLIAIHDAVRPFVTRSQIDDVCAAAATSGAAILAARVTDTVKQARSREDTTIAKTVPRDDLWAAQTPQVFDAATLRDAFARWIADGRPPVTDDASLLERLEHPVTLVESDRSNLKLTTPPDLVFAAAWLQRPSEAPAADPSR